MLEIRAAIIQMLVILAVLFAFGFAWYGEFTREDAQWMVFAQLGVTAILVTLSRLR